MTLRIERCQSPPDLEGLGALCAAHAAFEHLSFAGGAFEERLAARLFEPDATVFVWMARADGQAIGYASASVEFSTLAAADMLHLDCLFVMADARSQGVGLALIRRVAALARERKLARMEWQTPHWNTRAARFYERLGATALPKLRFALAVDALQA